MSTPLTQLPDARHSVVAFLGAKNCPELLEQCLSHLGWVDEIFVADASTNDEIRELCRRSFPSVRYAHTTIDDVFQRLAFYLPSLESEYILMVDADEFYPPELGAEILRKLAKPCRYDGFEIPSIVYNFGACWGDGTPQLRLFHRSRHTLPLQGSVHDLTTVPGLVQQLQSRFHHHNNPKLGMNAVKHFRYEAITANRLSDAELATLSHERLGGIRLILHAMTQLARLNVRFWRYFWRYRKFGFGALCHGYSQIFRVIAQDVSPTEEQRMRSGKAERGNRGYF